MREPSREQQFFDRMRDADADLALVVKMRERLRRIRELARLANSALNVSNRDDLREHVAAIRRNAECLSDEIDGMP